MAKQEKILDGAQDAAVTTRESSGESSRTTVQGETNAQGSKVKQPVLLTKDDIEAAKFKLLTPTTALEVTKKIPAEGVSETNAKLVSDNKMLGSKTLAPIDPITYQAPTDKELNVDRKASTVDWIKGNDKGSTTGEFLNNRAVKLKNQLKIKQEQERLRKQYLLGEKGIDNMLKVYKDEMGDKAFAMFIPPKSSYRKQDGTLNDSKYWTDMLKGVDRYYTKKKEFDEQYDVDKIEAAFRNASIAQKALDKLPSTATADQALSTLYNNMNNEDVAVLANTDRGRKWIEYITSQWPSLKERLMADAQMARAKATANLAGAGMALKIQKEKNDVTDQKTNVARTINDIIDKSNAKARYDKALANWRSYKKLPETQAKYKKEMDDAVSDIKTQLINLKPSSDELQQAQNILNNLIDKYGGKKLDLINTRTISTSAQETFKNMFTADELDKLSKSTNPTRNINHLINKHKGEPGLKELAEIQKTRKWLTDNYITK